MGKTKIEWCDYTINPVKGLCPTACSYCYARAMYKRFKWDTEIRYDKEVPIYGFPSGSRVFIGSTMELFGEWIKPEWLKELFAQVKQSPDVTFIFLTKQPQNLINWSPFPKNCWIGMTVTKDGIGQDSAGAIPCFEDIEAKVKFVSFEPLQEQINFACYTDFVDWVIIGAQSPYSIKTAPKKEWVDEIIDGADKAGIPVFLKNNLRPVLRSVYGDSIPLRQEFPRSMREK